MECYTEDHGHANLVSNRCQQCYVDFDSMQDGIDYTSHESSFDDQHHRINEIPSLIFYPYS